MAELSGVEENAGNGDFLGEIFGLGSDAMSWYFGTKAVESAAQLKQSARDVEMQRSVKTVETVKWFIGALILGGLAAIALKRMG